LHRASQLAKLLREEQHQRNPDEQGNDTGGGSPAPQARTRLRRFDRRLNGPPLVTTRRGTGLHDIWEPGHERLRIEPERFRVCPDEAAHEWKWREQVQPLLFQGRQMRGANFGPAFQIGE